MRYKSIFLMILALLSCKQKGDMAEEKKTSETPSNVVILNEAQFEKASLRTDTIQLRTINHEIQVNGKLDVPPQKIISISAIMGGYIRKSIPLQGMHVHKGELLARVENPEYINLQQDYLESKSKLDYLKLEYERQRELQTKEIGSKKEFQETESMYNSLKARINGLEEKIKMLNLNPDKISKGKITGTINIYSPINGYVTEVYVNVGKYVNPQDVLFEVVNTEHIHGELIVFEKDLPDINIGQKVHISLLNENTTRKGSIYLINKKIQEDRTIRVHAHLEKEDPNLIPGLYIKARIQTSSKKTFTLPDEAFVSSEGKFYVFIPKEVKKDHYGYEMVPVEKGISENGFTEISENSIYLLKGKNVIVSGSYYLLSALKNTEEE